MWVNLSVSAGQLVYQHDGSPSKTDVFVVELLDKSPDAANAFQISMIPVQMGPVLQTLEPAAIAVGGTVSLSQANVEIVAASAGPEELIFNTSDPKNGLLLNVKNEAKKVTSFSQQQINDAEIVYRHTGDQPGEDFFEFDVYDPENRRLGTAKFKIQIG
jgi:hypothetical protein